MLSHSSLQMVQIQNSYQHITEVGAGDNDFCHYFGNFQVQPSKIWVVDTLLYWRLTAIVLAECLQGTGSAKSGVRNCSKCKVAGTTIRRRQSPLRCVNGRTGKMHRG